jgi:hemoglobin
MPESSLYERLGGVFAIAAVIDRFSDAIVQNPIVGRHSANQALRDWHTNNLGRLPGLKFMRTLWVCDVAGGPFRFSATRPGRTYLGLEEAHRRLRIKPEEFDAAAAELARTLDAFNVPEPEKQEVLGAFAAHKQEVTEGPKVAASGSAQPAGQDPTRLYEDRGAEREFLRKEGATLRFRVGERVQGVENMAELKSPFSDSASIFSASEDDRTLPSSSALETPFLRELAFPADAAFAPTDEAESLAGEVQFEEPELLQDEQPWDFDSDAVPEFADEDSEAEDTEEVDETYEQWSAAGVDSQEAEDSFEADYVSGLEPLELAAELAPNEERIPDMPIEAEATVTYPIEHLASRTDEETVGIRVAKTPSSDVVDGFPRVPTSASLESDDERPAAARESARMLQPGIERELTELNLDTGTLAERQVGAPAAVNVDDILPQRVGLLSHMHRIGQLTDRFTTSQLNELTGLIRANPAAKTFTRDEAGVPGIFALQDTRIGNRLDVAAARFLLKRFPGPPPAEVRPGTVPPTPRKSDETKAYVFSDDVVRNAYIRFHYNAILRSPKEPEKPEHADLPKELRQNCIAIIHDLVPKLFTGESVVKTILKNFEKLKAKPETYTLVHTGDALARIGVADPRVGIKFRDAAGRLTNGNTEPKTLDSNAWDKVMDMVGSDHGWHIFGMAIMSGHHSVTLFIDNQPNGKTLYWADQWRIGPYDNFFEVPGAISGFRQYEKEGFDKWIQSETNRMWNTVHRPDSECAKRAKRRGKKWDSACRYTATLMLWHLRKKVVKP